MGRMFQWLLGEMGREVGGGLAPKDKRLVPCFEEEE